MDTRRWFLLNERPTDRELLESVKHVPESDNRGPHALALFLAGFRCDFRLTTKAGEPTTALRLMAKMMGAQLVTADQLPPEEKAAFSSPGPCLIDINEGVDRHWYLRDITKRIVAANAVSNRNMWNYRADWHQRFLPGWDGQVLTYLDPDGKKRKRVCVIVKCRPDWEMTNDVYLGIHRWTYDHHGPDTGKFRFTPAAWPDAYSLLREDPVIRRTADEAEAGRSSQELCSAAADSLPAPVVGVQHGPADGAFATAGD